jgi:hypothetical protein
MLPKHPFSSERYHKSNDEEVDDEDEFKLLSANFASDPLFLSIASGAYVPLSNPASSKPLSFKCSPVVQISSYNKKKGITKHVFQRMDY